MDWLSDAGRRISDSTLRPSVNTVTAEQQLGQLLSLVHEFTSQRARFQDLEKHCTGLERQSVGELVRQFERLNDACRSGLERQRRLFKGILSSLYPRPCLRGDGVGLTGLTPAKCWEIVLLGGSLKHNHFHCT